MNTTSCDENMVQYIDDTVKAFTRDDIHEILGVIGIPEWQRMLEGSTDPSTIQGIRDVLSPISCIPQSILKDDRATLYFALTLTERILTRK